MQSEHTLASAAAKSGMDEKTARKYLRKRKLPSEVRSPHTWRTRPDPFSEIWPELLPLLQNNPGLEAKTLFQYAQRLYPGRFADGKLRTLQRRVKHWRATEGPPKEVFFEQVYTPGERCQSDFTSMNALRVTIGGRSFNHLVYHFVLPYSNWETGVICFSESFESLSVGLQEALFKLGGVPQLHQTDSMSAAVRQLSGDGPSLSFTERYQALLRHYGMRGQHTQPESPHENGDVEQRHHRFKLALEQALLLRGSRNFENREAYSHFLERLFQQLNLGRQERFEEECARLQPLPLRRLETFTRLKLRVRKGANIRVHNNVYSVPSRLIGERVDVRLYFDHLDIWYGQQHIERIPRLRGAGKHRINYRHVIDWLVRKPGAFAHYRYQADLFPTHRFRWAYDLIRRRSHSEEVASKAYLRILHLAARENESAVDAALDRLIKGSDPLTAEAVQALVRAGCALTLPREIAIPAVELHAYDALLSGEVASW